jgi:hypothetical protein
MPRPGGAWPWGEHGPSRRADTEFLHPVGASIAWLIRTFATPYRARNVGNIVGNGNFRNFFLCDFNSLWRKLYSNSGSQIFQRFSNLSPFEKIEILLRGATLVGLAGMSVVKKIKTKK